MKFNDFINTGLLRDLVNKRRFSMKRVITRRGRFVYAFRTVAATTERTTLLKKKEKKNTRARAHVHKDETGKHS